MNYRLVTSEDWPTIRAACQHVNDNPEAFGYFKLPNIAKTLEVIHDKVACGDAVIAGGYLLLVATVSPFWADDVYLNEVLVMSILPRGKRHIADVLPALEELARERGCSAVLVNDSSLRHRMGLVYKRGGFIPLTQTYYKEV